ncbi:MAG: Ni/Fe-hydrogenase 1 b-type cytochrome subunit, partial [Povalibacter sp.]
ESGPLSSLVSFDTGRTCAELHEDIFNVLLVFIALHVAAVFFYLLYRRENLIAPMISGKRELKHLNGADSVRVSPVRLIVGIIIASACVWGITQGFG